MTMLRKPALANGLIVAAIMALLSGCGSDTSGPDPEVPPGPAVLGSISPSSALVGDGPLTLTATGSGFLPSSEIVFASHVLATTYVSDQRLTAILGPELLQSTGTLRVFVQSYEQGGTTLLEFQVDNPIPAIESLEPASLTFGGQDAQITVSGSGFTRTSVVLWNGQELPTSFESNRSLTATVAGSLLNSVGQREVAARNPSPGGGESGIELVSVALDPVISSFNSIGLRADDIVFDPLRGLIYASVTSIDPTHPNTIAVLEPGSDQVLDAIQVGSEPGPLAIADGAEYLYVGLQGAPVVQRIDLTSRAVDLTIQLGEDPFFGPYYPEDLVTLPGLPGSVIVSRYRQGVSPRHGGVAIFDGAVQRPDVTQDHTGSNRITPSGSSTRLYGWNNETSENGLREILVTANGLTEATVWNRPMGYDIEFDGGYIFSTNGTVVDSQTGGIVGSMNVINSYSIAPDTPRDRAFFVLEDWPTGIWRLNSYRISTFAPVAEVAVLGTELRRLIRWGDTGLAYVGDGAVAILTTSLINQ